MFTLNQLVLRKILVTMKAFTRNLSESQFNIKFLYHRIFGHINSAYYITEESMVQTEMMQGLHVIRETIQYLYMSFVWIWNSHT